jgi:hypothetical protein
MRTSRSFGLVWARVLPVTALIGVFLSCQLGSSRTSSLDELLGQFNISGPVTAIGSARPAASSMGVKASVPQSLVSRTLGSRTGLRRSLLSHNLSATDVGIFTIPHDSYWSSNLHIQSMVPVSADGSFNLPFIPVSSSNSVIMLVNRNATNPTELVVGFLAVPSDLGGALIELPLDTATGTINMGALSAGSDPSLYQSSCTLSVLASSFSASLPVLQQKALFDNGAKRVMNAFINSSSIGFSFKYFWYSRESIDSLLTTASNPSQYGTYDGYSFEINLPYDGSLLNGIGSGNKTIFLYPPAQITMSVAGRTSSADSSNPVTSSGQSSSMISAGQVSTQQDSQGNWIPTGVKVSYGDYIPAMLASQAKVFKGKVPGGMWATNVDSNPPFGAYDFSMIDPMRSNGLPAVFLPTVSSVKDGTGVTTYSVSFSYFDGSEVRRAADLADFQALADNFSVYYGVDGQGFTNGGSVTQSGNCFLAVPGTSATGFDFSKATLDALAVHYNMYGVEYFFVFNR